MSTEWQGLIHAKELCRLGFRLLSVQLTAFNGTPYAIGRYRIG